MKNYTFHRALTIFYGVMISAIALELIYLTSIANTLTIARLIFLLLVLTAGLTMVKIGMIKLPD